MNGFLTDPSEPGTERLVITKPRLELGMVSSFRCDSSEIKSTDGPEMLQAHGLVYCKGWTRSLVFVLVLHMAFENPTFWEAIRVKSLNYCFESWAATEMWADFTQNAMNICLNLRIWAQALSKGLAGQLQMLRQIKDGQSNLTNLLSRETAFDCFNHDVWRFIFIIICPCLSRRFWTWQQQYSKPAQCSVCNVSLVLDPTCFWKLRTFGTICANVVVVANNELSRLVDQNRLITLGSTVRRRPNAFNLCYQLKFLGKLGMGESSEQALDLELSFILSSPALQWNLVLTSFIS